MKIKDVAGGDYKRDVGNTGKIVLELTGGERIELSEPHPGSIEARALDPSLHSVTRTLAVRPMSNRIIQIEVTPY